MIHLKDTFNMDGYVLAQKPGNPSFIVKRNEASNLPQEQLRNLPYSNRYKNAQNLYHSKDSDTVKEFLDDLVEKWQDAVEQLFELRKEIDHSSNLNPAIEATSKRAYITTVGWLGKLFLKDRTLPCPDIVPSGDGGIDIEWTFEDRFISVQIHKSNPKNDRIYFKKENTFKSMELSTKNLLSLIR